MIKMTQNGNPYGDVLGVDTVSMIFSASCWKGVEPISMFLGFFSSTTAVSVPLAADPPG
jgi:hypothetical protein